tara:strand:- start:2066 stop:2890 length:825 start_codon:yes stop_codon:yes gene_type:complete
MEKYCNNCGNKGHSYRNCRHPILSYGIILYKEDKNNGIDIVMVERKDTLAYIEFLRGKYKSIYNTDYIQLLFDRLSINEKEKLLLYNFQELWKMLWIHTDTINRKIQNEYNVSERLFNNLKKGYYDKDKNLINLQYFIDKSSSNYKYNEWEIPKGRRNNFENNRECAIREFHEETNIDPSYYKLYSNIIPLIEEYTGINNVKYKHVYYIGKLIKSHELFIDENNRHQYTEVKDIKWVNQEGAIEIIREYNYHKQKIIKDFFSFINKFKHDLFIK